MSQLALFIEFSHHGSVTDPGGTTLEAAADQHAHANLETVIRDPEEGSGRTHRPSRRSAANAAWLAIAVLARQPLTLGLPNQLRAHNLGEAAAPLVLAPGSRIRSGRPQTIHLPGRWLWQHLFLTPLTNLPVDTCPSPETSVTTPQGRRQPVKSAPNTSGCDHRGRSPGRCPSFSRSQTPCWRHLPLHSPHQNPEREAPTTTLVLSGVDPQFARRNPGVLTLRRANAIVATVVKYKFTLGSPLLRGPEPE